MIEPDTRHAASRRLLAAIAWLGVLLQLWLSVSLALSNGKSTLDGLVAYLGYFTVLTNLFVAIVSTIPDIATGSARVRWRVHSSVVGCATTSIVLVGIVYHLMLRELWSPQGLQWLADMLLHYVVPAGALMQWLMAAQADRLRWWAPLAWCAYPLAYLVYALLRGEMLGVYPYPFIDVPAIGYRRAVLNAIGLIVGFVVLGYLVVGIAAAARRPRSDRGARRSQPFIGERIQGNPANQVGTQKRWRQVSAGPGHQPLDRDFPRGQ